MDLPERFGVILSRIWTAAELSIRVNRDPSGKLAADRRPRCTLSILSLWWYSWSFTDSRLEIPVPVGWVLNTYNQLHRLDFWRRNSLVSNQKARFFAATFERFCLCCCLGVPGVLPPPPPPPRLGVPLPPPPFFFFFFFWPWCQYNQAQLRPEKVDQILVLGLLLWKIKSNTQQTEGNTGLGWKKKLNISATLSHNIIVE